MTPTKHYATKKSTKRVHIDSANFKSIEADLKYNDCYNKATIIMERVVKLETLEDTFIPEVFKERTWTKLLNLVGVVYSEIIKEFFSNASVEGDTFSCVAFVFASFFFTLFPFILLLCYYEYVLE